MYGESRMHGSGERDVGDGPENGKSERIIRADTLLHLGKREVLQRALPPQQGP